MKSLSSWFLIITIAVATVPLLIFVVATNKRQETCSPLQENTPRVSGARTKCLDISQHTLRCTPRDEQIFHLLEKEIIEKANKAEFKFPYNPNITTKPIDYCKKNDIYDIQCVESVYHLYKIGLVTCTEGPPHLHLLPNEQESLLRLPPVSLSYPCAPPFTGDPNYKVRIAYTILVHGYATTFARLIRLLYHPDHFFAIHLDKHTPPDELEEIKRICERYHLFIVPERFAVYWGALSIMYAQLSSLFYLKDEKWDFWVTISGVDLPLKSNDEIVEFLRPKVGNSFITSRVLGNHDIETEELYFDCVGEREAPLLLVNGTITYKDIIAPLDLTWHLGPRGMILSKNATMYLLYHPDARLIINRSKYIYIADEKTFHTIIHSAPQFKELIVPDSYHFNEYIMPDLPFFTNESQPFLFGRKWKDDEKAREFEKWFVLNKPTYVPT